ncbi:unnamed protein product, partial [Allacma fusca]
AKARGVAHHACFKNHLNILKTIQELQEDCLEELDQDGNSPLHIAVISEAVDSINFLMRHAPRTAGILNKK